MTEIFENCLTAFPVFYRTYSRVKGDKRETWGDVCTRTTEGLRRLGRLTKQEAFLIYDQQAKCRAMTSGRYLWVGGTEWSEQPENFPGVYNCSSTAVDSWEAFSLIMDVTMMGCGAGAMLEPKYINQLPPIVNKINLTISRPIGERLKLFREDDTSVKCDGQTVTIHVGDSRQGWVDGYTALLETASASVYGGKINVEIDLSSVRPAGERLKGFGGISSPVLLPDTFINCAKVLNKAVGRQLNSLECCLLIDHAALAIVAGNIRRCIAYGERVSTISGIKPIQDINVGELVLTSSGEYKPVVNKFIQGVQDIVEIRTAETSIRCTANHRVAIYNGLESYIWKTASELQHGDRMISVPHRKGLPCSTADYAWLVGFFIGDGHADIASAKRRNRGGGSVTFSFSKERVNGILGQKCLRILKSLGYTPSISVQENHAYIKVHRKELADELIQYKHPWSTPIIPEFIWLGTEEIRGAFLAGLADADAGPSRNVLLNSNKIEFLRQVQKIALSLGIATTLHEREPKKLPGRDRVYEGCHWLKIRGIQSQINSVALINPFMGREGFRVCGQKKNGLSLPYEIIEEAMALGWRAKTITKTRSLTDPSKPGNPKRDANWDTLLEEGVVNPDWLPIEVKLVVPDGVAETFDIEVEEDHEFICEGLLVHNSAGIKQSSDDDHVFTTAKDNLWQQDEHGHWSIDPERDALRMSNHTRVFHKKPTRDEVLHAVNKQYYSGEGAIQWVGESIARANCDLPIPKQTMIEAYENGTLEDLIRQSMPDMDNKEISHRLQRYGLNPCLTADNWVLTADGPRTVLDLVGEKFEAVIHGDTVPSDDRGFWLSGIKEVYRLQTEEGFSIRLTDNHKLLKANGEWVEAKELQYGDQLLLHNHRGRFDEICFDWLSQNLLKAEGLTLQDDMELPLFLAGNKEHLETIQRYLIWSGVFSTIESTDRKSSLVIRGDSQEALRELITYSFHKDESALTKSNKTILASVKSLDYEGEEAVYDCSIPNYHYLDCNGFVTHNCGEIIMYNNFCNLGEVHLNLLDPKNEQEQYQAFKAAALSVAALLHHEFVPARYQYSREVDPIVGVSFTGLFDFFVNAFGVDWLKWWEAGRPEYYRLQVKTPAGLVVENANVFFKEQEQAYLNKWKVWVHDVIWEYCDRHGLRRPNRCTTVQPSGCWDKTALRVFEQGLFYADEFMSPGQGDVSGFNLTVRNGMTVRSGIANQLLPIAKVTLKNGRVLRMTHDHRLSVDGKWVRADNLTEGMTIDFSLGEYDKKDDAVLLPLDQSHYTREYREQVIGHKLGVLAKEITTPSVMSPELGYFLGCMFGNGSFSKTSNRVGRIRFSFDPKNMEIVERLQSIAGNLFGLHGVITYDTRNPECKLDLCFASNQLFDWFNLNGLDKVKSKNLDRIPLSIRRSSKETILSFICGLIDTDGCIRSKGSLSIDSASESFTRNLQQIGEAVGLSFSVFHNTQGQNLQKEKDMWGLCLSRMVSKLESLNYLNKHSYKCQKRNLFAPKRYFKFNPYSVESIELETIPDYTYDFSVDGIDDNDSWYWQGGLKSHNSKSLLTGASPGWHPPKAQRFIRRITFRRDDPVALACIDYGYNVIPSQSDKDENGKLLNDPYDPRCTEWLVEIPVEVNWANVPGADTIDISKLSVLAQFDFYMQVQKYYTSHNSSATLEFRENEIEPLADRIYQAIRDDEGYISAALLARFDDLQTFPRLPFEPISKEVYERMVIEMKTRQKTTNFHEALSKYDFGDMFEAGPAGCDSDKCLIGTIKK